MVRRTAEVLNILIASPSDVGEERNIAEKTIHDWNAAHFPSTGILLNPIRWESHAYPAIGDRPQAIINRQIVDSGDILIAIFGYKLGTPTGEAQSGTIEEIEKFRIAGKYVALYFSTADVPRNADRDQLEALEAYKNARQKDTLYSEFVDTQSFRDHLTRHLPNIVQEVRKHLRIEPSQDSNTPTEQPGQQGELLAEIITELEDNLDRARRPVMDEVYRTPSTGAWLKGRNKIAWPPEISANVKGVYRQIDNWLEIVRSGLSPNTGSMPLNLIVTDLRMSLPPLIDQIKNLQSSNLRAADTTARDPKDRFVPREPLDGRARFRRKGEPLGIVTWGGYDVFLDEGPAMWLRLMPERAPNRVWLLSELEEKVKDWFSATLTEFGSGSIGVFKAEDGCGSFPVTAVPSEGKITTHQATYMFETGELWTVSAFPIYERSKCMPFDPRRYVHCAEIFAEVLTKCGIAAPFQWIAGIEGVKGWSLPDRQISFPNPRKCLADRVAEKGKLEQGQSAKEALKPFFEKFYDKCGEKWTD